MISPGCRLCHRRMPPPPEGPTRLGNPFAACQHLCGTKGQRCLASGKTPHWTKPSVRQSPRRLEHPGIKGASSPCRCVATAHDGSAAVGRVLGLGTREPGHRATKARLHARRAATVFLGNSHVDRIVACLRREKSQLSSGCRQVFDPDGRGGQGCGENTSL